MFTPDNVQVSFRKDALNLHVHQVLKVGINDREEVTEMKVWPRPQQVVMETHHTYLSKGAPRRMHRHFTMFLNIETAEAVVEHLQASIAVARRAKQ